MYRPIYDRLCDELELDALSTFERWEVHKEVIREAASLAKEAMFLEAGDSTEAVNMRLTSIARAVTRNDTKLANILMTHAEVAREHIEVRGGRVSLNDPAHFQRVVERSKLQETEVYKAELEEHFGQPSGDLARDYSPPSACRNHSMKKKTTKNECIAAHGETLEPI